MGKRTKVPTALHSELSEYASLLRALRTNSTLDLASQLTSTPNTAPASCLDDGPTLDDDGESERPFTDTITEPQDLEQELAADEDATLRNLKRKAGRASKAKAKAPRDNWTRWPLLAGDVHVPEWSLEDEVSLLATQSLKAQLYDSVPSPSGTSGQPDEEPPEEHAAQASPSSHASSSLHAIPDTPVSDDEDALDSQLPPRVLGALTASSGRFLSQILALLTAYVPPGGKSMQNRMHPINWESVLDIVGVNGLVDNSILDIVRQRLSAIYPPSADANLHVFESSRMLRDPSPDDLSFLEIEGYNSDMLPKRKRGPYQKRINLPHERPTKRLKSESVVPEG
ncbi:hypothetical protein PHLGIDRAFT_125271 [Phlebiopsis gigantea 11061_1 CR5-6]|uniref:Uncharacterized protein n=1 Tax=Phlebiopsis gigantea (strain 11061_1 CR5-6) TaxID=745531 RepID=A0A0C3PTB8_PHLG1|nr:hypothetical protein PHLGIDRAFT_125271 [Phlebiopsis gigantea 11061_1 CR5-6]